ncbi:MAG TPA: hypothetical protein PLQ56_16705 [Aggregatilineales bacterium]|nr:hypothetical protein [Aggregatilineales bacterium]
MMGGMGVIMLVGLFAAVVLIRWLLPSQRWFEVQPKRKNEDLLSFDESYELDDEVELQELGEEKDKRAL